LSLDPGNAEARENAELTRRELTGDPEALANAHGVNGSRLLGEGRAADALAEFREAARLQPLAARSYLGIGSALVALGHSEADPARRRELRDEAIASYEHALALEPNDPTAQMNLGIVYLGEPREPAKVIEHFRAYLRLVPDAPQRAQMERTIREMERSAAPSGK
jgi:tetratricopeptide (TPR) repeat protein